MDKRAEGICPVCNGTGRVPADHSPYNSVVSGYDRETNTHRCTNCGGQYMYGQATGQVSLNRDGEPCTHEYTGVQAGRCYWRYTCKHCGDQHSIDSGD